jgi:hypothetical protein
VILKGPISVSLLFPMLPSSGLTGENHHPTGVRGPYCPCGADRRRLQGGRAGRPYNCHCVPCTSAYQVHQGHTLGVWASRHHLPQWQVIGEWRDWGRFRLLVPEQTSMYLITAPY